MLRIRKKQLKNYAMKSTNTGDIAQDVASILFDIGAVIFRPRQPFRYASGILSPVYTDNRLIMSYPKIREKITKYLVDRIKIVGIPDVICGTATAGIPHAAFVAWSLKLPLIYARSQAKDHGKASQVEGVIKRGQKAIVIEDLVSTGNSSLGVVAALRRLGVEVNSEVSVYTYGFEETEKDFAKNKVKLFSLCDLNHSLQVAEKRGFLQKEQVDIIRNWAKDPQNWGKKNGV